MKKTNQGKSASEPQRSEPWERGVGNRKKKLPWEMPGLNAPGLGCRQQAGKGGEPAGEEEGEDRGRGGEGNGSGLSPGGSLTLLLDKTTRQQLTNA